MFSGLFKPIPAYYYFLNRNVAALKFDYFFDIYELTWYRAFKIAIILLKFASNL